MCKKDEQKQSRFRFDGLFGKKGKLNKYTVLVEDVECTKNEAEKIRKEARRIEDYLDRSRAEMERDYTSRELSTFLQKYRWKKQLPKNLFTIFAWGR